MVLKNTEDTTWCKGPWVTNMVSPLYVRNPLKKVGFEDALAPWVERLKRSYKKRPWFEPLGENTKKHRRTPFFRGGQERLGPTRGHSIGGVETPLQGLQRGREDREIKRDEDRVFLVRSFCNVIGMGDAHQFSRGRVIHARIHPCIA